MANRIPELNGKKIINQIKKIRRGEWCFISSILFGLFTLTVTPALKRHGTPNSIQGSFVAEYSIYSSLIAIFVPFGGLLSLKLESAGKWTAFFFWISMIFGVHTTTTVICRSFEWMVRSAHEKAEDMNNFTLNYLITFDYPGPHITYTTRQYKCCGVNSYLDWAILYTIVDTGHDEINRQAPSICCANETKDDCADTALKKIFQNTKTTHTDVDFYRTDDLFKKAVNESVNIFKDRKRLGELFRDEICDPDTSAYKFEDIYIYYEGPVRIDPKYPKTMIPCVDDDKPENKPKKKKLPPCSDSLIFNVFQGKTHFCSWIDKKGDNLAESELIYLVEKDGRVYGEGCYAHLAAYVDAIVYSSFLFSLLFLALFIAMICYFFAYYWEFREPQMAEALHPFWYEPMWTERKEITGFEDELEVAGVNFKNFPRLKPRDATGNRRDP